MKTCPFCAELIQDAAVKCRFCGSMLNESAATQPQQQPSVRVQIAAPRAEQEDDNRREQPHRSRPEKKRPAIRTSFKLFLAGILFVALVGSLVGTKETAQSSETQPSTAAAAPSAAEPTGERILIPSDPKATYFVLERSGDKRRPILTTKRVGPSGTGYSRRVFDCERHTFKYLAADVDKLEDIPNAKPDVKMGPLVDGSISEVLWRNACRR